MTTAVQLTPEQQQAILTINRQQAFLIGTANQSDGIPGNQFIFFSGFDGTNNDLSNRPQTTNIPQLATQASTASNERIVARYYAGPGTKGTLRASSLFGPRVTQQVINKAQEAYRDFQSEARNHLARNPGASIAVALASFSRGGASAAIFTQLLYANGLVAADGRVLIAPGQIPVSAGVIFDPVLTGISGNMAFAPNARNLVDILARNEYRDFFEAADYRNQQDILAIIPMFGAHSDIGGGYDNGIGALSLEAATHFLQRSGLAIDPVPSSRQYQGPLVLHSENDGWPDYGDFESTDITVDTRRYVSFAEPATLTALLGRPAKSLLLFDGRTITISDKDSAGMEKVKMDSRVTTRIDLHEITTFRISATSTAVLNRTSIQKNNTLDSQTIRAVIFDGSLDINVPAAHSTLLSIKGPDTLDRNGALILGDEPAGFRIEGGTLTREGTSTVMTWLDEQDGLTYRLIGGTLSDGKGSLRITGTPVGAQGNSITIENFVDGKVGISFEDRQGIHVASTSARLAEGSGSTVTVKSDSVSDQARIIKVLTDNMSLGLEAAAQGKARPFLGGELDLVLPAGQTEVTFALLQRGDIDAGGTVDLTAKLLNADGTAAATATQSFALAASVEVTIPPVTARDIVGGFSDGADDLGNHDSGTFDPDRDDTLNDSAGNDHILAGGGSDLLFATQGGDDWIEMGAGSDTANAGAGDDLVAGAEGVDVLFGGMGEDRLFAAEVVDSDTAIAEGISAADAGPDGGFVNGNEDADLIAGDDRANILEGGAGDDRLIAGGGDDTIEADGDIRDLTLGASFTVTASSTTDADGSAAGRVVIAGAASRFAVDAPGDDIVHAGGGNDFVFTGAGNDVAYGDDGADHLFGEAGNDTLLGGEGNDVLSGDNGGSLLDYPAHGADFLDGGGGDDRLFGGGASDVLYGGGGNDVLFGDSSTANAGDDYLSGDAGDDELEGGMGKDTLLGGSGNDTLLGDNGGADASGEADLLDGGAGNDTLAGQGGDDTLLGGDGADFLQGNEGADILDGGGGADTLLGGSGADTLAGGGGNDIVAGDNGGSDGSGDGDLIDGGEGDDTLAGQGGDDVILGGDGADRVLGGEGSDVLEGGSDDDLLQGDAGDDWLEGGDGIDTVLGGQGQDVISGGEGDDLLVGDDGLTDALGDADAMEGGAGDDQLFGQVGDDRLAGDDGNDLVDGGEGNDTLEGGGGDDRLAGGMGDDILDGGEGADWLDGGSGDDVLAGGDGADVYSYDFRNGGVDYLDDVGANTLFLHGIDPLSLRLNLGSLLLAGGDPANQVHLENFDADDVAAGAGVDTFVFDDGTTFSYKQLLALGFDIAGTPDGEVIMGTSGNDSIDALEGDDYVVAKPGDDSVDLGAGNDIAEAGDGNDTLYGGIGDDRLFGEDGDDLLDGGAGADLLAGGSGDDTYLADAFDELVEAQDGGFDTVETNEAHGLAENIEKLVLLGVEDLAGTGNLQDNTLVGNAGNNALSGLDGDDVLSGGEGNDRLEGGAGADAMRGEAGDDVYVVDQAEDQVIERDLWSPGGVTGGPTITRMGHDSVESAISFALPRFVEHLVLTGSANLDGAGNAEQNILEGNAGANELVSTRLDGLNDNLVSGPGAVLYLGTFSTGRDERLWDRALARYFLGEVTDGELASPGASIEVGARAGDTLIGNGGDDRLLGGWDDDQLDGGAGNDFLVGSGGYDVMAGGEGDDAYVVDGGFNYGFGYDNSAFVHYGDDSLDEVTENENGGSDTVYSNRAEYWLEPNVENLVLLDPRDLALLGISAEDGLLSAGKALVGFGNELDNVLTGNAYDNELYGDEGSDTLFGREGDDYLDGQWGADTMVGGIGNDSYAVRERGDLVVEDDLPGYDSVEAGIDYTLTANVEELFLNGETYEEDLSGTGNELDNAIYGNYGDNVLSGLEGDDYLDADEGDDTLYGGAGNDELRGGFGADTLLGGAGNDLYWVDDEGDIAFELADEGHDVVYASVRHTLGDGLDDLVLLEVDGFGDPVGAIDGTGNELANAITGNESDNVLSGLGGDDALSGGAGADALFGGDGDDTLEGGTGEDVLAGGGGDDFYFVDASGDEVVEQFGEGNDQVISSASFALSGDVENLTLLGDFGDGGFVAPHEGQGNAIANVIIGNDGFNRLEALAGDDRVDGRAGRDIVFGNAGDDRLYGGDDATFIGVKQPSGALEVLASNRDSLNGGEGNDTLDGGSGNDFLGGDEGDDVLYGGDDGLWIDAARGFSEDGGEEGGDASDQSGRLFLANDDWLDGGAGDDLLDGGPGNDQLFGGDGNDRIYGGADGALNTVNDDTLDGGAGVDLMAGGSGDDSYAVDGTFAVELRDLIDDCGELQADVPVRIWATDEVIEAAGEGYDTIRAFVEMRLPDNVEALYLQEGAFLAFAGGNAGDNDVFGNSNGNVLQGGAGNDRLYGGSGDDLLDGGPGDDELYGDAGDDVYDLGPGSGRDIVYNDAGGFDIVHVTQRVTPADVTLSSNGFDVTIGIDGTRDRLTLASWFLDPASRVREIEFCDGSLLEAAEITSLASLHTIAADDDIAEALEDGPAAVGNLLTNDRSDGAMLSVVAPGSYAGEFGILNVAADGSYAYTPASVQWLAEGESRTESFGYEVQDEANAHDAATLRIQINGRNDAPELAGGNNSGEIIEDRSVMQTSELDNVLRNGDFEDYTLDSGWSVEGETAYTGVTDGQSGGTGYFGAIGAETLLRQDVASRQGEDLRVRFRLRGGAAHDAAFRASWNGELLASVEDVVLPDYTEYVYEVAGRDGTSQLEFALRNDPDFWYLDDIQVLPLERTTLLPDLQTAESTLEFSDVDAIDWHAVASIEPQGSSYVGEFSANLLRDSSLDQAGAVSWSFQVANEDLQFLSEGETRTQSYQVTLADAFGARTTRGVTIRLHGANDQPFAQDDEDSVSEDGTLLARGNVLANDGDPDAADTLSVLDSGTYQGRYGVLVLDADGSYTYSLDNAAVDFLGAGEGVAESFAYQVTDGAALHPLAAAATLSFLIQGANDSPVTRDDSALVSEDGALVATGNVLANDTDADAQSILTVSNAGTYGSLELGADGSFIYTLDNGSAAVQALAAGQTAFDAFTYLASDGVDSTPGLLAVAIAGANDAPLVAHPIADQIAQGGVPFGFTFAADAFADVDEGEVLGYAASLADGTALPGWLVFDGASRTFSGTPVGADSLGLRVTASDPWGASAIDEFILAIAGNTCVGQHIVGTDGDDVLAGTACGDVIDGGKGYDVMAGGDGDDVYYVDATCPQQGKGNEGVGNGEDAPPPGHEHNYNDGFGTSPGHPGSEGGHDDSDDHGRGDCGDGVPCKVDVVVEQADAGYDAVNANTDYVLPANVEELRLVGSADLEGAGNALDNVLAGNSGDNRMAGGLGSDTYLHELNGGDDFIEEVGSDSDTLAFGAGIDAGMVTLQRRRRDLVVDIAGAHDSVTVKDWFASAANRVETIRFADGTAWSEHDIERATSQETGCLPPFEPPQPECNSPKHDRREQGASIEHEHARDGKDERDCVAEAIDGRLRRSPRFDFERRFEKEGERRIAEQWRRVAAHGQALAMLDDDGRDDGWQPNVQNLSFAGHLQSTGGFGFEGSTGAPRGPQDLKGFHGLGEGFRRL